MHRQSKLIVILWILLPVLTGFFCLCLGRYTVPVREVFNVLCGKVTGSPDVTGTRYAGVVWNMRLPRILLAILVGSGLSCAGVAFQSLFANPLATPDTLGVASGASLGAVIGLFLGCNAVTVQLLALASGFSAVLLTFLVGYRRGGTAMTSIVLAGMVISSLYSAFVSLFKYVADTESQLPAITYWLMGSLSSAVWPSLRIGTPLLVIGIAALIALRWRLNILPLSEDEARSTGVNLNLLRLTAALCATMITASSVAMCGQVAWVGLLVPHICRMMFGSDNTRLVPASVSFGAVFMLIVDTIARSATASEIPVSIITAIIGAPFFIHFLRSTRGWNA